MEATIAADAPPALAPVPTASPPEVAAAVARARAAQEGWARRPLAERGALVLAAARTMLERRGQIVDLVRNEIGKLEVDALFTEGLGPLDTARGWLKIVERETARRRVRLNPVAFPRKRASVDRIPRGVVGVIAPWNFPVAGLYRSVFPALLCGNAVVVKPSEHTPRSSAWFVDRLAEHLPPGVIQAVQGAGSTGAALVDAHPDALVFTGSTVTGRKVAARAAELGIPCSVETGGNDAAIVLADADLERTTAGLTQWSLQNAGQSCGAIEVAYVDRTIADALASRLARAFSRLRIGPGPVAEVDVSPLAHAGQLATVEAHVEDARSRGATVLTGGRRGPEGLWYEPTLLDHCTDEMRVVSDETFGPVLALCRVEGPAEAVRRVNRGRYGLTCSFWTADAERAERLARRLEVGVVTVNNHGMTGAIPELPWSGVKASGPGVANGPEALSTFVFPRTLLVDDARAPEPFWMPYDRDAWNLADLLAELQLMRFERAWRLPTLFKRRVETIRRFFA